MTLAAAARLASTLVLSGFLAAGPALAGEPRARPLPPPPPAPASEQAPARTPAAAGASDSDDDDEADLDEADEARPPTLSPGARTEVVTETRVEPVPVPVAVAVQTGGSVRGGNVVEDLIFAGLTLGLGAVLIDHAVHHDQPKPGLARRSAAERYRERDRDARQGFLFSFGLGGEQLDITSPGLGKAAAIAANIRFGWGFSDRFQLFGDFRGAEASYPNAIDASNWMLTLRGQTVLLGDRDGNGLNLNAGFGLGGVTYQNSGDPFSQTRSAAGLAFAAGLSYDARLGRAFSLSPELFANWHAVPNTAPLKQDIATDLGLELNFKWTFN